MGCAITASIILAHSFRQQAPPGERAARSRQLEYVVKATARASILQSHGPLSFQALAFHPDGRWLLSDELVLDGGPKWQEPFRKTTYGSRVLLRRADTLAIIRELPAVARVLAVSPDGERLLGLDRKGWAAIWDTRNWSLLVRLAPGSLEQPAGVFSPSAHEVGFVDRREQVSRWDVSTGQMIARVPVAREIFGFLGSGENCLVSSGRGSGTTVFAAEVGLRRPVLDLGQELGRGELAVSADGSIVARAGDDQVLLWRADRLLRSKPIDRWAHALRREDWAVHRRIRMQHAAPNQLAWSPDGTTLIVRGRAGSLWHIDRTSGALTSIYTCKSTFGKLAASRGAKLVAVSSGDRIVMLKLREDERHSHP